MKRGLRICLSFDRRRRQKAERKDCPRPRMSGKREKIAFRDLGEPKNAEKRSSSADETQKSRKKRSLSVDEMRKTRKSACRRSTKREKR